MRKRELLIGQYNVYAIYDKISKHYKGIYFASNDEDFIRLYLPTIVLSIALRELTIYKIATFNDVTGEIKPCSKKVIKIDCYLFPHNRLSPIGENLSIEDIEKEVNETKNKIIAESSNSGEKPKEE